MLIIMDRDLTTIVLAISVMIIMEHHQTSL